MAGTKVYQPWRSYHDQPTAGEHKGKWFPSGGMCPAGRPVEGASPEQREEMLEQAKADFVHQQQETGEPDARFEIRVIWPVDPKEWQD